MLLKQVILQIHEENKIIRRIAIPPPETFNTILKMLKKHYEKDYPTKNFLKFLEALFDGAPQCSGRNITLIRTSGSSDTVPIYFCSGGISSHIFNNTYGGARFWYIGVGSGTTPSSLDDYELESKVKEAQASVSYIGDSVYVTGTLDFDTDVTISEIALYYGRASIRYLMDRTVLDQAVSVSAGQMLTVSYRFALMT